MSSFLMFKQEEELAILSLVIRVLLFLPPTPPQSFPPNLKINGGPPSLRIFHPLKCVSVETKSWKPLVLYALVLLDDSERRSHITII